MDDDGWLIALVSTMPLRESYAYKDRPQIPKLL